MTDAAGRTGPRHPSSRRRVASPRHPSRDEHVV